VDVYELLTIKIDQAKDKRKQDLMTVQKWERAAKAKSKT
jgi:hypothetical protein